MQSGVSVERKTAPAYTREAPALHCGGPFISTSLAPTSPPAACCIAFIQLLESRAVGHYAAQDVALSESQLVVLDNFYETLNFAPAYHDWPVVTYYGYYQRRLGCSGAADRFLYVDADGDLHACPSCQKKAAAPLTGLLEDSMAIVRANGCQLFHPSSI